MYSAQFHKHERSFFLKLHTHTRWNHTWCPYCNCDLLFILYWLCQLFHVCAVTALSLIMRALFFWNFIHSDLTSSNWLMTFIHDLNLLFTVYWYCLFLTLCVKCSFSFCIKTSHTHVTSHHLLTSLYVTLTYFQVFFMHFYLT